MVAKSIIVLRAITIDLSEQLTGQYKKDMVQVYAGLDHGLFSMTCVPIYVLKLD